MLSSAKDHDRLLLDAMDQERGPEVRRHSNTSCLEEFSRTLSLANLKTVAPAQNSNSRSRSFDSVGWSLSETASAQYRGKPKPVTDGGTNSMAVLEEMGGLAQPEFSAVEEREQDSMGFSCLSAVRRMQETGKYDEAKEELAAEMEKARARGEFEYAISCCMIAELFNRWGAAASEYSGPLMEQASEFASIAEESLRGLTVQHGTLELETACFWKALNFATLAGNGGCKTTALDAMRQSEEALKELESLVVRREAPLPEGKGRCVFVEGIQYFTRAKAMKNGFLEGGDDGAVAHQRKALELFEDTYEIWESEYGDIHPDTVKAVTMIAFTHKSLNNVQEALQWAQMEYETRVELFGERHPRTVHAKRCLNDSKRAAGREVEDDGGEAGSEWGPTGSSTAAGADDVARFSADLVDPESITWEVDPFETDDDYKVNSIMQMFHNAGVTTAFGVPQDTLARLIVAARAGYHANNSFHNWNHAWSVTESAYLITMSPSVTRCLGVTSRLAVLVAALLHDIDHPGVNSDFLIKSADPLAMKFPTPNVLERHHWGLCQELLTKGAPTDILCNIDDEERENVMATIFDGIMATDMALHKAIVTKLQERRQKLEYAAGPAYDPSNPEEVKELVQAILHTADLSAQSMPANIAYKFGRGIVEEFHAQFTRERRENLLESAFMKDMHKPLAQAKAQLGFLQYVAGPLWKAFGEVFPELADRHENIKARAKEIDFDQVHQWHGLHKGLSSTYTSSSFSARSFGARSRESIIDPANLVRRHFVQASFRADRAQGDPGKIAEDVGEAEEEEEEEQGGKKPPVPGTALSSNIILDSDNRG